MLILNLESGKLVWLKHSYIAQGNLFTLGASDALLFSISIWNPKSTELFSFKHMYVSQQTAFTHDASYAILSAAWFWNSQSQKLFLFKAYTCSFGGCVYTWYFWRKFILSDNWSPESSIFLFKHIYTPQGNVFTHGASDAILSSVSTETPNLENYFNLSTLMLLRAMCPHMSFSESILSSLYFWNLKFQKNIFIYAYLSSAEQCLHTSYFWRNFIIIMPFRSLLSE